METSSLITKLMERRQLEIFSGQNASFRAAYADFGDCITFDTTYQSNTYHIPLAVFVGVNNHLQSVIFGVALMGDESEESFDWVFATFLKCMLGKQPLCILIGAFFNPQKQQNRFDISLHEKIIVHLLAHV